MVFDNVEDLNDLNPYLPLENVAHGSILITTQKPTDFLAMKDVGIVPVKRFGRDDAEALLFKYIHAAPADEKERNGQRTLGYGQWVATSNCNDGRLYQQTISGFFLGD